MEGKVVLITGGAKRVGAAICRRLHKAGASIMLHFRSSAGEARLLQAELNHLRANSVALIQADLLDVAKLPSLAEQTVQSFGRLDALVNNASAFYATTIGDIDVEQWNDLIGTNLQVPDLEKRRKDRRHLNLTDDSEKPAGQWNKMEIEAKGDQLTVWVNGDLVNHGTNLDVTKGAISLQSEGALVYFRNIYLTPLK